MTSQETKYLDATWQANDSSTKQNRATLPEPTGENMVNAGVTAPCLFQLVAMVTKYTNLYL